MTAIPTVSVPKRAHWVRLHSRARWRLSPHWAANLFSVHVEMTSTSGHVNVTSQSDGASAARMTAAPRQVQPPTSQRDLRRDLQHLMHPIGACLGLLAGGALLLTRAPPARQPVVNTLALRGDFASTHLRGTPARSWSAPPLSPPTSSPVIRT